METKVAKARIRNFFRSLAGIITILGIGVFFVGGYLIVANRLQIWPYTSGLHKKPTMHITLKPLLPPLTPEAKTIVQGIGKIEFNKKLEDVYETIKTVISSKGQVSKNELVKIVDSVVSERIKTSALQKSTVRKKIVFLHKKYHGNGRKPAYPQYQQSLSCSCNDED